MKKIAEKYMRFTTRVKRSSNKQGVMVCDDEAMTVECSRGLAGDKKSNFYCHKMQTKITRHLETVHRNEKDVQEKKYVRLTTRGNRGKTVPVLVEQRLRKALELVITLRKEAGVPSFTNNMFGLPGGTPEEPRHLQSCVVMRAFSEECGASEPKLLRGTKLRKHIATNGIMLNLDSNDITDLASFMGHDEKIHKEHYRQAIAQREILQISRLLERAHKTKNEEGLDEDSDNLQEEDEDISPMPIIPNSRSLKSTEKTRTYILIKF